MKNELVSEIKKIEQELIDLKTASKYTSIRSAFHSSSTLVYTGIYRIKYNNNDNPVFSIIYCNFIGSNYGLAYPRTPNGNEQIVEIDSTYFDGDLDEYVTQHVPLSIASNVPVTSIERIS